MKGYLTAAIVVLCLLASTTLAQADYVGDYCGQFADCYTCTVNAGCGWQSDGEQGWCLSGDYYGPFNPRCGTPSASGDGWNSSSWHGWNSSSGDNWNSSSWHGWNSSSEENWNSSSWHGWNSTSGGNWNGSSWHGWNSSSGDNWNGSSWHGWNSSSWHGWNSSSWNGWNSSSNHVCGWTWYSGQCRSGASMTNQGSSSFDSGVFFVQVGTGRSWITTVVWASIGLLAIALVSSLLILACRCLRAPRQQNGAPLKPTAVIGTPINDYQSVPAGKVMVI